jgi:DNA-binding HxlR family transcriptional regulator
LVAAEWAPAILRSLVAGPQHYTQILASVRSLDQRERPLGATRAFHESTLSRCLKRLTDDGVVEREVVRAVFPPSVRYSLTAATRELLEAAVPLAQWAVRHAR